MSNAGVAGGVEHNRTALAANARQPMGSARVEVETSALQSAGVVHSSTRSAELADGCPALPAGPGGGKTLGSSRHDCLDHDE